MIVVSKVFELVILEVSDAYERIRHNQYSWKAIVTALYIARVCLSF